MNIIFLHEEITRSLVSMLTIIENYPDCIVGCILISTQYKNEQPPSWFIDSISSNNPALTLFSKVNEGLPSGSMNAFLIVREPSSLLNLNVLAAINCFNFNSSGEGGRGGKKLLELLAKHNIRTYPHDSGLPVSKYSSKSLYERNEQIKADVEKVFGGLAEQWLPASWGVEPVVY